MKNTINTKKIKKIIIFGIIAALMGVLNISTVLAVADDVLYFPGGGVGINKSKDSGVDTPIYFGSFYSEYKILYYGKKEFDNPYHSELFNNIKIEGETRMKLKYKIFNTYETKQVLEKELEKVILEVEVSKFRYKNNEEANRDEKDIKEKLDPIIKLKFESKGKTNGGLRILLDKKNEVCGDNIAEDTHFETVKINSDDIKEYYLLGIKSGWDGESIYGSPWDKNHKTEAFIIKNKKDLKKINKSKFFLYKIDPTFKKVEYTESYNNDSMNVNGIKKGGSVLVQNKTYKRVISTNMELKFSLKYSEMINYFKENNNLYNFQDTYTFGSDEGTKRALSFKLLGVENDGDVRILTKRGSGKELDLSREINTQEFIKTCDNYFEEGKKGFDTNDKKIHYAGKKLDNIFKKLDIKSNIEAYHLLERKWKNSLGYGGPYATESGDSKYKNEKLKLFNMYGRGYKKYYNFLKKIDGKISNMLDVLEKDKHTLLNNSKKSIIQNKEKIKNLYFKSHIIQTIIDHSYSRISLLGDLLSDQENRN